MRDETADADKHTMKVWMGKRTVGASTSDRVAANALSTVTDRGTV